MFGPLKHHLFDCCDGEYDSQLGTAATDRSGAALEKSRWYLVGLKKLSPFANRESEKTLTINIVIVIDIHFMILRLVFISFLPIAPFLEGFVTQHSDD